MTTSPNPAERATASPHPERVAESLHPDCPDLSRLGPTPADALLRAKAARAEHDDERRTSIWSRGFTRRRLIAGAGMVGVAGIGSQLVTTRVSFAAPDPETQAATNTLVVIFLRGGQDGLSILVPGADEHLTGARPNIRVPAGALVPLTRGFGMHPALEPLRGYWNAGTFSMVPALSTPDLSRSHFQAQDCLERGGRSSTSITSGWLDRTLTELGAGTTFRAISESTTLPRALVGPSNAIAMTGIDSFKLSVGAATRARTTEALERLYTGFTHPLRTQALTTLHALDAAARIQSTPYTPGEGYPNNSFSKSLQDIARLIKSNAGLRVACVDLGGWDMHTGLGTIDTGDMQRLLKPLGQALAAFAKDLGSALGRTTVLTMTEFGRRLKENASGGLDHGHGSVAMLMGGGLKPKSIAGAWPGLAPDVLVSGDVPGSNDFRDLLGEVLVKRFGLTTANLGRIFPDHSYRALGAFA